MKEIHSQDKFAGLETESLNHTELQKSEKAKGDSFLELAYSLIFSPVRLT